MSAFDGVVNHDGDTLADVLVSHLAELATATNRIADTLDDYMEMTLGAQAMTAQLQSSVPEAREMLQPMYDLLETIRQRRAERR